MKKFIKLELKRTDFHAYVLATFIIALIMLGFLYLFAYVPKLEPNDADIVIFTEYKTLIPLYSVLNMAIFCVLAAVIYTKLIIEEYSGKRSILLFSYPVSRKKIMLSKLCIVYCFTLISMATSNIIIFCIFGTTEKIMPLVHEHFTFSIMLQAIETTLIMSFIAASIGVIAVGIGFIKKSVPVTIISAVIMASLMCNIVLSATSSKIILYILMVSVLCISLIFSANLMKKVDVMEI